MDDDEQRLLPKSLETAIDVAIERSMTNKPGELPSYMRTANAREAFQAAFETVGGMPRLAIWANQNYGKFVQIYSRLLPVTVGSDPNQPITVIAPWLNGARLTGGEAPQITDVEKSD